MSSFPMHVLNSYINTKWDDLSCKQKVFTVSNYTRRWMNFKITHLEGFPGSNIITFQVETFTGSHNLPNEISTFEFEISFQDQIRLLEYQHIEEE